MELLNYLNKKSHNEDRVLSPGGTYESRTRLKGFADLCVTAPPTRRFTHYTKL